ncbi:hypothetical protein CERZMDRAFT_37425, partial [Cercospora zeae-maydis SCOH1-5]
FRFIVGSNATEFFAHSAIITGQSKPLTNLMNGTMREAREGQARIEDVDENTFANFLEFCYTKNYPAAEHAIALSAASDGPENPSEANMIAKQNDQVRPNKEACEDYTNVFLSHARMYVFADTYAIEPLRLLSLQKLHKTLSLFMLYPERGDDIGALLRYTYENTTEREGKLDDLRELVLRYVCCNMEKLWSSELLKETLRAENSSSVDLIEMLWPRLD